MKITRGMQPHAKKVVLYGPEGIGKSTFASRFPEPVFIDTEGSTKNLDIARFEKPSSWMMLLEQIRYVKQNPETCRTLVIDTIDWAEQMCVEHVCTKAGKTGIEDFGYGNGYVYVKEEFGRFLNLLEDVVESGVNIVLSAHAQMRKFEQPDEAGAYDRWEMKLGKKTSSQTSPLVKEWADMVLFANYKTLVYNVDGKGAAKGKNKVQGGKRVMYTSHHPCWDAKNRYGLADELDLEYSEIAAVIEGNPVTVPSGVSQQPANVTVSYATKEVQFVAPPAPLKQNTPEKKQDAPKQQSAAESDIPKTIPKALRDLMIENGVGVWDIQNAVFSRGYYPIETAIENYEEEFIQGCLVDAWPQVFKLIQKIRDDEEIPFN